MNNQKIIMTAAGEENVLQLIDETKMELGMYEVRIKVLATGGGAFADMMM